MIRRTLTYSTTAKSALRASQFRNYGLRVDTSDSNYDLSSTVSSVPVPPAETTTTTVVQMSEGFSGLKIDSN